MVKRMVQYPKANEQYITDLVKLQQVRVWKTHSLHGDSPFTEQPGECGEEGDYIQVETKTLIKKYKIFTPGVGKLFGK